MGKSSSPSHISSGFTFEVVNLSTHLPLSRHCIENVHEPDGDDHARLRQAPGRSLGSHVGRGAEGSHSRPKARAPQGEEKGAEKAQAHKKKAAQSAGSPPTPPRTPRRLPDDVWQAMTPEEKKAHRNQTRRSPRRSPGSGRGKSQRIPEGVWKTMSPGERRAHVRAQKRERQMTEDTDNETDRDM